MSYPKGPFYCLAEAQDWVDAFVCWYNNEHRHDALNWTTPAARHNGFCSPVSKPTKWPATATRSAGREASATASQQAR